MYEQGFGVDETTDPGFVLGEGYSVMPEDLKQFANALSVEQGTFVYFDKASAEAARFMKWLSLYDPSTIEYFAKINSLKMNFKTAAEVPGWIKNDQFRFNQEVYKIYTDSIARVGKMTLDQGVIVVTVVEDATNFLNWWAGYDRAGYAAFVVTNPINNVAVSMPKDLFNFWKMNQGKIAPSNALLGKTWVGWTMLQKYWVWIAVGAAGGVLLAKGSGMKRPIRHRDLEDVRETLHEGSGTVVLGPQKNPRVRVFRDAFPTTIRLKSGKFELIPLVPRKTYDELRALSQHVARRFRVVSDGRTLGELHKSRGRRPWKVVSYQGVQKYGRNRGTLLTWLKQGAPVEAAQMAAKEPEKAIAAQQAVKQLAANAQAVYSCNGCH